MRERRFSKSEAERNQWRLSVYEGKGIKMMEYKMLDAFMKEKEWINDREKVREVKECGGGGFFFLVGYNPEEVPDATILGFVQPLY